MTVKIEKVSEFMTSLASQLIETKGIAESSAQLYIRNLYTLNNKAPFKSLSFLRKKEDILKRISEYAESTQKSLLTSIVSVLSLVSDKQSYKSIYKLYYDEMMGKSREAKENESSEKTEKQKENWISWKEVLELTEKLKSQISDKKVITSQEYDCLLQYVVLSLYTLIQPRRNQDYLNMVIVKKSNDTFPNDVNYLDVSNQQFIFNKYKTSKKYGKQTISIPEPLMEVLGIYLKHHSLFQKAKGKLPVPFLITAEGKPLTAVNAITRILNKVLGKKVGSSMLRHIFLSDKYDINEMEEDATAMGHSVEEQKKYMKGSGTQVVELPTFLEG